MAPWTCAQEVQSCLATCGRKNDGERVRMGGGVGWGWTDKWTDERSGRAGRWTHAWRPCRAERTWTGCPGMNVASGRRPKNACGTKLWRFPSKCWHVEDYDITMQMVVVGIIKTNILVWLLLFWNKWWDYIHFHFSKVLMIVLESNLRLKIIDFHFHSV